MEFKLYITYAKDFREDETIRCDRYILENGVLRVYSPEGINHARYNRLNEYSVNISDIHKFKVVSINESD